VSDCNSSNRPQDDAKTEAKLAELEERLRQNPFDYAAHVEKVATLKNSGELVTSFPGQVTGY
jgi:hypothetical protein